MADNIGAATTQQVPAAIIALDLRLVQKPFLIGFFTAWCPTLDLRIPDCTWWRGKDGAEYVRLPEKTWTTAQGETRYRKTVEFGSSRSEKWFATEGLKAVQTLHAKAAGG
jgi:hypothetical protein